MRSHSQYLINVQYSKGVDVLTVNLKVSILDTSYGLGKTYNKITGIS